MNRVIACLIASLLVAGCGGQPSTSTRATSILPAPTPSASTPAPTMPRAARKNTPAGATAFARYFIEVRNYAITTGRTAELRKITAPECFECLDAPTLIDAVHGAGGRIEGGVWEPVRKMTLVPCSMCSGWDGRGFLQGTFHLESMRVVSAQDKVIGNYPGSYYDRGLTISTSWREGRWYVEDVSSIGGQRL